MHIKSHAIKIGNLHLDGFVVKLQNTRDKEILKTEKTKNDKLIVDSLKNRSQ